MSEFDIFNQYFIYNPDDGSFRWRVKPKQSRKQRGDLAGNIDPTGYLRLKLNRKKYSAHRVAWLLMTGNWPTLYIDHINLNKLDNRWVNLRQVTPSQNNYNRKVSSLSKTGVKGVRWHRTQNAWRASIRLPGGKRIYAHFHDIQQAANWYKGMALKHHGEFAVGYPPDEGPDSS